jgi:hypothetical protein
LESDSSSLIAYPTALMQYPPTVNPLPAKLSSNVLDSEFDDDILNSLIPNLVPNLNELKLLGCKV